MKPEDHDSDGSDSDIPGIAVHVAKPKLAEPKKYAVFLLNDDYTTFDFVVEVLIKFFRKTYEEASEITLKVHHAGKGLAGIYSHQIAETKALQVCEYASSKGFPLKAVSEPA